MPLEYIRAQGKAGRLGARLLAVIAEGARSRVYLAATVEHERVARIALPDGAPDTDLPAEALGFRVQNYGMTKHRDLFTHRQLAALTTFADLVGETRQRILVDSTGNDDYANAVATSHSQSARARTTGRPSANGIRQKNW
jgi:putative DNA methylase